MVCPSISFLPFIVSLAVLASSGSSKYTKANPLDVPVPMFLTTFTFCSFPNFPNSLSNVLSVVSKLMPKTPKQVLLKKCRLVGGERRCGCLGDGERLTDLFLLGLLSLMGEGEEEFDLEREHLLVIFLLLFLELVEDILLDLDFLRLGEPDFIPSTSLESFFSISVFIDYSLSLVER